ncbi:MAG: hypothetical protein ACHQSE_11120 [Gemmatimonadales bacterium]
MAILRMDLRAMLVALAATAAAACSGRHVPAAVQHAEFIVTTGDSSYWVTSGPQGLRMRGVPMLLARVDGRYREIYVADDDRSYFDAVLVGARLWSRDLVTGDSSELFADSLVPRYAADYARAHPGDTPLGKDDEAADHPRTSVTADVDVVGVHGPYVSYEYRTDMDIVGERENVDRHTARRGVLDLRTGKPVTVAALFGGDAAAQTERDASAEWKMARDSLLALRDRRSRRAQRVMAAFDFDGSSFTIASRDGRPRVVYAVPGVASRGSVSAVELAPREVPAAPWWRTLRDELPAGPDSLLSWKHGAVELRAALTADGDAARLVLRDASRRDWRVGVIGAPVWRVLWLDGAVKPGDRKALSRAFNDASMYSADSRIVVGPRRAPSRGRIVFASFARP